VTASGECFSWGKPSTGALGLGNTQKDIIYTPKLIRDLHHTHILRVSCGSNHTLFLSKFKEVFACGLGEHGQLGHGFSRSEYYPKLLSFGTALSEKTPII